MSQPFLGEIRMFGFQFAPRGWAACNGQMLAISQNSALFSLLGTTYGGNGQTTFALPNLQSRTPMHFGSGFTQGQAAGSENVTLISSQMPQHNHTANAATTGTQPSPTGGVWGQPEAFAVYNASGGAVMAADSLAVAGGNQPHPNLQPYLVINFCIALQGIFPSRN